MNDQECNQTYEALSDILKQYGLEWVTTQVTQQILLGKTIEQEIETLKEDREARMFASQDYSSRLKRGPKATFPVPIEYKPSERLELLIDAVQRSVISTTDMEHHLVEFFESQSNNWQGIQFSGDEPGSEPKPLDRVMVSSRVDGSRKLKELLEALRREI